MFQQLRSKLLTKVCFAYQWDVVILNFLLVLLCTIICPHIQKNIYDDKEIVYYERNFCKKYCLSKPPQVLRSSRKEYLYKILFDVLVVYCRCCSFSERRQNSFLLLFSSFLVRRKKIEDFSASLRLFCKLFQKRTPVSNMNNVKSV